MPHIHTEDGHHDLTVSAYIAVFGKDEPKVLLHLHKKLNQYLQFGGHVELNETPWQAIAHELKEESGYEFSQLKILQPRIGLREISDSVLHPYPLLIQTHSFGDLNHYHTDIAFAFTTREKPKAKTHEGESTNFKLVGLKDLKNSEVNIIKNVKETCIFLLTDVLKEWEEVSCQAFV